MVDGVLLGEGPFQIIIDAANGAVLEARELGTAEATDPARYALNEAWFRKKVIICVIIGADGFARSARSETPKENPFHRSAKSQKKARRDGCTDAP